MRVILLFEISMLSRLGINETGKLLTSVMKFLLKLIFTKDVDFITGTETNKFDDKLISLIILFSLLDFDGKMKSRFSNLLDDKFTNLKFSIEVKVKISSLFLYKSKRSIFLDLIMIYLKLLYD